VKRAPRFPAFFRRARGTPAARDEEAEYSPTYYAAETADMRKSTMASDALTAPTIRTCNLHTDCDAADAKMPAHISKYAAHCHDDCCEDCFGS
jgi:hypothetical protein